MTAVGAVGVVVPARDEEVLLPGCLASLRAAAAHPALGGLPVVVVVALDACTDATAEVAAAAGVPTVAVDARNVGAARAAGFAEVLRRLAGHRPRTVWLATTDADSRVPAGWLAGQVAYADAGADAVVSTVRVDDWSGHPPGTAEAFARRYAVAADGWHGHVHGANLGLRASVYLRAGGFPPLALAEDHALLAAVEAHARRIVRTDRLPVVTSARRDPRTPGGFGDLLRELGAAG